MRQVRRLDESRRWREVSVIMMDDEGITPVNRTSFGKDRPTDTISFAYPAVPGAGPGDTGEVLVNVERAVKEGPAHRGQDHELALYIAHGCHHLAGAEDDTPARRNRMLAQEESWLQAAADERLLAGLIRGPESERTPS